MDDNKNKVKKSQTERNNNNGIINKNSVIRAAERAAENLTKD